MRAPSSVETDYSGIRVPDVSTYVAKREVHMNMTAKNLSSGATTATDDKRRTSANQRRRPRIAAMIVAPLLAVAPVGIALTGNSPAQAATRMPSATINPNAVALAAGSSTNLVVTLAGNRPARFAWALSGKPAGVSATLACPTLRSCVLSVRAEAQAATSTSLLELALSSGSSVRRLPIALHVQAAQTPVVTPTTVPATTPVTTSPAGASLSLRPSNLIANTRPGARATFPITVVRSGLGNQPVSLAIASLPTGWQAAFLPNPTQGESTVLIVDAPQNAAVGDYPVRVSASVGSLVADTLLVVRVRIPEISLGLISAPTFVPAGGSGRYLFDTRSLDDSTQAVFVRAEGLPGGVTATATPNPAIGTVAVDVTAASNVTPLSTFITIVASRDGVEVRLPVALTLTAPVTSFFRFTPTAVAPVTGESTGYGLTAVPSSLTATRGSNVVFDVLVTPKGGFVSPIDVALVTPSGWSVVWSTVGVNVFRATVAVPIGTSTGVIPLVLNTSSGSLVASLNISATIS